jgi:hypothetical protein
MKTKNKLALVMIWLGILAMPGVGQEGFQSFIRQVQLPFDGSQGAIWNMPVAGEGQEPSPLEINPGGARFELHTVRSEPFEGFLLDTKYVSTYIPVAEVQIRTEDPYETIPRTRADRPFNVEVTINGLLSGAEDPVPSKKVKLLHHVQSYGADGDGTAVDRTQASLIGQGFVESNGTHTLTYLVNSVPGANRAKVRGEERFSVYSLADYQAPESHLDSLFVQIWPVADGTISGISDGEVIGFKTPTLTMSVNDIYPDAQIYVQAYQGEQALGTEGVVLPGSALVINESVPQNRVLAIENWDSILTANGTWTVELLISTPFGIDRLDWITFTVDRTITVRGSVTTSE